MRDKFRILAGKVSTWAGSPIVFVGAILVILIWAISGPAASYSNTWQLIINTGTTIVTFLMVFLIQNTQNRDGRAMQLKLDELIRAHKLARDRFVSLEDITDDEMEEITNEFRKLHEHTSPNRAMHKLHLKLEQEHAKRKGLKGAAEQIADAMMDSFNNNSKIKK